MAIQILEELHSIYQTLSNMNISYTFINICLVNGDDDDKSYHRVTG